MLLSVGTQPVRGKGFKPTPDLESKPHLLSAPTLRTSGTRERRPMSAELPLPQQSLPERPNLRHLKDEAWRLLKSGQATTLSDAQFQIAKVYGFPGWPALKAHVECLEEVGKLKHAIDTNDFNGIKTLMRRNPALHRAPLGYGKSGPLTWVAECRVPWEAPSLTRLAIAQWMIDHGSDVHQGGNAPLMRAALVDHRIPMMDLLVRNGADVNAEWNDEFPILYAPCETIEPLALKWLLDHGADPNLPVRKERDSALDYLLGTYVRSVRLGECIDLLIYAGSFSIRGIPAVLELLRGRFDRLSELLEQDSGLVHRRFTQLDFGSTAGRRLTLRGATLLHVAAEYGSIEAATLLLAHGAAVNAKSLIGEDGIGGQTPLFHAASQIGDFGFSVTQLLVGAGADLDVRAKLPGHYERPEEVVDCTALGYARLFPGHEGSTTAFLRSVGAPE